jgi:hypothetical protein
MNRAEEALARDYVGTRIPQPIAYNVDMTLGVHDRKFR